MRCRKHEREISLASRPRDLLLRIVKFETGEELRPELALLFPQRISFGIRFDLGWPLLLLHRMSIGYGR